MKWARRLGGAALGFGGGALLAWVLVAFVELAWNASFVDDVVSTWVWCCGGLGVLGAIVGAGGGATPRRWHAAPAAVSVIGIALLGVDDGIRPIPELRVLVYGIDGATWTQIDPMIARGELPALAELRASGATGVMHAEGPLFSPILWTTLATGVPMEEHGVQGFAVRSLDCRVPRFFEIAEHEGFRVGTYKWLVTWPPRRIATRRGFIVPGWLAPSPETWPRDVEFVKEIELSRRISRQRMARPRSNVRLALAGLRHGFRFTTLRDATAAALRERFAPPDADQRVLDMNLLRARMDRDVFVSLMQRERPDLATFTYYATDAVPHRFWRWHEPEKFDWAPGQDRERFAGAVPAAYAEADSILAEVRRLMPEGARLLVVSDHGFTAASGVARVIPRTDHLQERLLAEVGPVQIGRVGSRVTIVLQGDDRVAQVERFHAFMGSLDRESPPSPDAPRELFRWSEDANHPGTFVVDLVRARFDPGVLETEHVGGVPLARWVRPAEDFSGDHDRSGIFAAYGPGVAPGARVDIELADFAPIALASLGLPIAEDVAGVVPEGLWSAPGTVPSWKHVRASLEYPEFAHHVNVEALEALGYVDGPARPPR